MDAILYPIGLFVARPEPTDQERTHLLEQLQGIANDLRKLVNGLTPVQLGTPYRQEGWTIRQVIHHLADNDMNAYIRLKRALTEEEPMGGTYREDRWALLHDYRDAPIELSINLMEMLHQRLFILLSNLDTSEYRRTLRTEALGLITIDIALQRFIWHNRHHMAQIAALLSTKGWLSA